MESKDRKSDAMAPPLMRCEVCGSRAQAECSHADCPHRRRTTAQAVSSYAPMGSGCLRRMPTCRE